MYETKENADSLIFPEGSQNVFFFFLIRSLYLILRSWKQANIKEEFNFWNRLTLYQNLCFKKRQEKCEFRNTSRRNGLSPITGGFQPDFDRENNVSKSVKNKFFRSYCSFSIGLCGVNKTSDSWKWNIFVNKDLSSRRSNFVNYIVNHTRIVYLGQFMWSVCSSSCHLLTR